MVSATSSVTRAPTMCTPSTGPSLAATTLTIPPWPWIRPLAVALKGNLLTTTPCPCSLAWASVSTSEAPPGGSGGSDRREGVAGARLGDQEPLGEGGVGQGQRRRRQQVADRVDTLDVGLQGVPALGDDEAAVQLDPDVLIAQVGGDRPPAGGH